MELNNLFNDSRSIDDIIKSIILLQENTILIKKETEENKQKNDADLAALKKKNDEDLAALKQQTEKLKQKNDADLAALKKKNDEDLAALKQQTEKLKQKNDADSAALKQKNDADLAALKQKNDADLAALKQKNEADLAALKQKNEADLAILKKEMDEADKALKFEQLKTEKVLRGQGINAGFATETILINGLQKTLTLNNIKYDTMLTNVEIKGESGNILTESDIILLNGKYAAIVEVKYRVTEFNINDFYKNRVPKIKQAMKELKNKKIQLFMAGQSIEAHHGKKLAKIYGIGLVTADTNGIIEVLAPE